MNTLYISDLDGTLLNKEAELSEYTRNTLNELINKGMKFTIATARSAATVNGILKGIHLNLPVILMNGVLIYDFNNKTYINIEYLPEESLTFIISTLKQYHLTGFLYEIKQDTQTTYYERLDHKAQRDFYEERVRKYQKPFTQVSDFSLVSPEHIIYLALLDRQKNLEPAYEQLKSCPGIAMAYYKDIYSEEELWYLEIFSKAATKYNAVRYLRNKYHYETIVGFGDNLNDLPLFKACDITCAVKNAKDELKAAANYIIDSNTEDGVARWLSMNAN
ncbi:Cof-type HAD-IIB family hydrolase [Anaerocolumna sedimenticola]|uniref:Cof-type HAD-IIB family hydrolase n=1 Tax=Anaerocolumna sedimenticola TaxID=2696063 RepID=A0A6P1TJ75_9FIRM|nr:HAD family hydrolase [Anaerocolumna sedimenticola]QHQ60169.1 Cof-type HAD-IIB family hydrolase [Anaerocolumna sedimenticola]